MSHKETTVRAHLIQVLNITGEPVLRFSALQSSIWFALSVLQNHCPTLARTCGSIAGPKHQESPKLYSCEASSFVWKDPSWGDLPTTLRSSMSLITREPEGGYFSLSVSIIGKGRMRGFECLWGSHPQDLHFFFLSNAKIAPEHMDQNILSPMMLESVSCPLSSWPVLWYY